MKTHTCTHNGKTYDVYKLIELSKKLPVKKVEVEKLAHYLRNATWSDVTKNKEVNISAIDMYNRRHERSEFMDHINRAMRSDLQYPIIMSKEYDAISDGVHRLLKAYITKEKYINVVTFQTLPRTAIVKEKEE